MTEKKIIINNTAAITAEGKSFGGCCKPVYCITAKKFFSSVKDAAEWLGVYAPDLVNHLKGKTKKIHGHKFIYVSEMMEHMDEIVAESRVSDEEKQKAAMWDTYMAEREAKRKKEEKRNAEIEKAKERIARRERIAERKHAEADAADVRVAEARAELAKLLGETESKEEECVA